MASAWSNSRPTQYFAECYVESHLRTTFNVLANERFLTGLDANRFAQRAAFYLSEINAAHPFREGNGRTQREFIRELALKSRHKLSWDAFDREEFYTASAESIGGNLDPLVAILARAHTSLTVKLGTQRHSDSALLISTR